jgi:hypothetical protein
VWGFGSSVHYGPDKPDCRRLKETSHSYSEEVVFTVMQLRKIFFLAVRSIEKHFDVPRMKAWRMLKSLQFHEGNAKK